MGIFPMQTALHSKTKLACADNKNAIFSVPLLPKEKEGFDSSDLFSLRKVLHDKMETLRFRQAGIKMEVY